MLFCKPFVLGAIQQLSSKIDFAHKIHDLRRRRPHPERIAEWKDTIEALREYGPKELSRYDRDFLDGIEARLDERGFLSTKQREYLESLHGSHRYPPQRLGLERQFEEVKEFGRST